MKSLEDKIDILIAHFSKHLECVHSMTFQDDQALYKKTLYIVLLDSLSKCVYPKAKNRERFINFVQNFSEWKYGDRVSLPHLNRLLQKNPAPEYEKIRNYINGEISKWYPREIITLEREPKMGELVKFVLYENGLIFPSDSLQEFKVQHCHLLYSYRNFLVHELRQPGYSFDEMGDKEPFYYHLEAELDDKSNIVSQGKWCLVYPSLFFYNLCRTSLRNLQSYLLRKEIDPFQFFEQGNFFLDELNKQ